MANGSKTAESRIVASCRRRSFLATGAAAVVSALSTEAVAAEDAGDEEPSKSPAAAGPQPKGKYRVGVIGDTGHGDYGHALDTAFLDVPQTQIVAVADANEKGRGEAVRRLKAPKDYADYREMLREAKPDVVCIAPRFVDRHCEMILAAVEAGVRGIYIEKPLCRTLEEADAVTAACAKANVKLAIAFQTRYSPKFKAVQAAIHAGAIGKVLEYRARGKEDPRGGSEDLFVLAPHLFNMMHVMAGRPQWCFASISQQGRPITKADVRPGPEGIAHLAGDEVHATYRMGDGTMGFFDSVRAAGGGPRFGLFIYGSKGVIEIGTNYMPHAFLFPHTSWSPLRSKKDKKEWVPITSAGVNKPEPLKGVGPHNGDVDAVRDLLLAIENNGKPQAALSDAVVAMEMVMAVFESQRLGKPVNLPLANRKDPLGML